MVVFTGAKRGDNARGDVGRIELPRVPFPLQGGRYGIVTEKPSPAWPFFVYAANGHELGVIDVPDRPLQLLIGGTSHSTLFILTHHALYSVNLAQTEN